MAVFVVWPLLSALRLSFYAFNGLRPAGFIGLENFRQVLLEQPYSGWTYNAFMHNVIVFASLMVFENGVAFLLAFALLKALPGHRVHQVIVFLPVVLSAVIVGFLWKLLLHPLFGLVNQSLALVGVQGPAWLGDESTALGSVILANVWHWLGFPTLVLLAGMQRIGREALEAARLDGAGDFALLTKIILASDRPKRDDRLHSDFYRQLQLVRTALYHDGAHGFAGWRHGCSRSLFLPHRLWQHDKRHPGLRPRQRACRADVSLHRRRNRRCAAPAAPARDRAMIAAALTNAYRLRSS